MSPDDSTRTRWLCTTSGEHQVVEGSLSDVAAAVRAGADLRRFSTYDLQGAGLVEETMTLQTTWVFDDRNVGGLQTLRHPVDGGTGIQMEPSMALWIFGLTAPQCSAFVPLHGRPMPDATGNWTRVHNDAYSSEVGKYVPNRYRWWKGGGWELICAHDEKGNPSFGSWTDLRAAANEGGTFKVGIRNLWSQLAPSGEGVPEHEVFVEATTHFAHIDEQFFAVLTQPTFLLQPCLPLRFSDDNFAPGWLVVRSDGKVQRQTLNPATMQWGRAWGRYAVRWFVQG